MNNNTIRQVLILGALAIMGIISMQSYIIVSTWNVNEEEFNKKVNLALYNVARQLATVNQGSLPGRDIIKRKTSNYYIVNMEDEINTDVLEYFLQKELEHLALNIDFEYAVFDCSNDEMVYGNYHSYNPEAKPKVELGNLPKDDELTYYFGIKFPTRSNFLFSKMQLTIVLSVLLFMTILFFAWSMHVILRQKHLSEMQKEFINNMTHEFKTPISTIKISSEVLAQAPEVTSNQRLQQYASIIHQQNNRLNNQVEKVLQISRVEGRGFELKKEMVCLEDILKEVVNSCEVNVEEKGGTIEAYIEKLDGSIVADRLHLKNILHSLLDNAIKYCKEVPEIKVSLFSKGKKALIEIEDKGIGIAKEYSSKLFDKFYRVPTGNVHNVKGFGLGLYYVKNICDAHAWKIKVDSEKGVGTKVSIEVDVLV